MKHVDDNEAGRGGRPTLSGFARKLLAEWRRLGLPQSESRIVLAVSGGADSMALLLAFDELAHAERLRLFASIAHLDHGLRGRQGERDARWVAAQAERLRLPVLLGKIDVGERATKNRDNLEQAARRARYEFLARAAAEQRAGAVLLAHTLDDQAETVLLRLLRGSGAEGLGGMRQVRPLVEGDNIAKIDSTSPVVVVRPLLSWARRADTESYCRSRDQGFLYDAMNTNARFARVRVRKDLLPLMRSFNPRIEETLARTATLLREDAATLDDLASALLQEAIATQADAACVDARVLAAAAPALQRRALRLWLRSVRGDLRRIDEVHVRALQSLLGGERGGRVVEMPGGGRVERRRGKLRFTA